MNTRKGCVMKDSGPSVDSNPDPSRFDRDTEFFKAFYKAERSDEEVLEATEVDWFGKRALKGFLRRISGNEKAVLEAGVGSGRFCSTLSGLFPGTRFVGLDIVPELAGNVVRSAALRKRDNLHALVGDITRMPFPDSFFDVTFNQGVVEHTGGRHQESINEMARVTRQGGSVIVTVPNYYCFPHTIRRAVRRKLGFEELTGDEPPFRHREMLYFFEEAGLGDIRIEGYYFMQSIMRLPKFTFLNRNRWTLKAGYILLSNGGMLVERLVIPIVDLITGNRFSNRCGFEIMVSGVKK